MSKRHMEEFNPWPAFVDILSSVILVLLLFVLVLLVNLGYYMQFKYKVSYAGSVTVADVLENSNTSVENVSTKNAATSEVLTRAEKLMLELKGDGVNSKKDLDSPGVVAQKKEDKTLKNIIENKDKYLVVNFINTDNFIDDKSVLEIKDFIEKARSLGKHEISISSIDSTKNISITSSKQISLARLISTKNLIINQGYGKNEVKIKFNNTLDIGDTNVENGLLIIRIETK